MIFVTGGTGLVGSHLLFELARKEESVRALYRTEQRREHVREIFALFSRSADELFNRIDWIQGDLHDFGVLEDALAGVELVFHCAALVSFNPRDRRRLFHINEQGTANIVNLSLVSGVRKLAYVSSVAALDGRMDLRKLTSRPSGNQTPVTPVTAYRNTMQSNRFGEELKKAYQP